MPPLSRLLLAVASTAVPLGWFLASASAAGGGLSVTPAVIERTAARGDLAPVTLVNTTDAPLRITVTPRPWTQARSGAVTPDRRRTLLSSVAVSVRSFRLPAGGRRTVTLRLKAVPKSGSLYGSVETIAIPPADRGRKSGITAAYRLISSLRLNPTTARRRVAVRASAPRVKGRAITLPVRNTGNTVAPVSGDVRIKGARGTRTEAVPAKSILPGTTVDLGLGRTQGLPAGTYTVTVSLTQAGKKVLRSVRRLRVP